MSEPGSPTGGDPVEAAPGGHPLLAAATPGGSEVLDLTKEEPGAPPAPLTTGVVGSATTLADWTRVALAGSLVGLLAVLALGAGWFAVSYPSREPTIESFLKLVFTPVVGLVGSVVGFYFGSRTTGSS